MKVKLQVFFCHCISEISFFCLPLSFFFGYDLLLLAIASSYLSVAVKVLRMTEFCAVLHQA